MTWRSGYFLRTSTSTTSRAITSTGISLFPASETKGLGHVGARISGGRLGGALVLDASTGNEGAQRLVWLLCRRPYGPRARHSWRLLTPRLSALEVSEFRLGEFRSEVFVEWRQARSRHDQAAAVVVDLGVRPNQEGKLLRRPGFNWYSPSAFAIAADFALSRAVCS